MRFPSVSAESANRRELLAFAKGRGIGYTQGWQEAQELFFRLLEEAMHSSILPQAEHFIGKEDWKH